MNPYGVNVEENKIRRPLISLQVLYDGMPSTSGCEQCPSENGDDAHWCCKSMNPSMYYVEFIKVWEQVQKWSKQRRIDIFVRAIENYLFMGQSKGCIFWKDGCQVYEDRPFYCRLYGVIPEESFSQRVESIKEREEDFEFRPQCPLVKSDKPITVEDEDTWFEHINKCEQQLGVPDQFIKLHDIPGGCYRTFHDHLLLEILEPSTMNILTGAKLSNPSKGDIKLLRDELVKLLKQGKLIKI